MCRALRRSPRGQQRPGGTGPAPSTGLPKGAKIHGGSVQGVQRMPQPQPSPPARAPCPISAPPLLLLLCFTVLVPQREITELQPTGEKKGEKERGGERKRGRKSPGGTLSSSTAQEARSSQASLQRQRARRDSTHAAEVPTGLGDAGCSAPGSTGQRL